MRGRVRRGGAGSGHSAGLRVLHVVTSGRRRGAEVFASDLIRALPATSVRQQVAVLRGSGPTAVDFGVPVAALGARGLGLPGVRMDPRALLAFRRLLHAWRPDVVQAHGGDTLKYVVWAARRGTPVVYRRIGGAPPWAVRGLRRVAYGDLMRRATRVVTVAEILREEVVRTFGVPRERVLTIPNGVDPRRMEPTRGRDAVRRQLGIGADADVLVSIGALTWEKDPLVQLEIADRLIQQRDVVLVMVGAGSMRGSVERETVRRGLVGRVLLVGSRSDVSDLLAAGDVLLFASRVDGMEGMPASVIEAGMMGLPVAGYAVAGVPEVVIHGTTGLLVPAGDVDGLTTCVMRLLEDRELRRTMGDAASARCRSRFDIGCVAPQYLELYERLAAGSAAA